MNKPELLAQLERLSKDYYYNRLSFSEYRKLRSELLKEIDKAYNSQK